MCSPVKAVPRVGDAYTNDRELMSVFASVLRSNSIQSGSKRYLCKKWLMETFWVEAPLFAGWFWVPVLSSRCPARVSWLWKHSHPSAFPAQWAAPAGSSSCCIEPGVRQLCPQFLNAAQEHHSSKSLLCPPWQQYFNRVLTEYLPAEGYSSKAGSVCEAHGDCLACTEAEGIGINIPQILWVTGWSFSDPSRGTRTQDLIPLLIKSLARTPSILMETEGSSLWGELSIKMEFWGKS